MIDDHSELSRASVEAAFQRLIDLRYRPYVGTLYCGQELSCPITLSPPPLPFKEIRDFMSVESEVSSDLVIKGMLSMSDVASPPVVSRHLVLTHQFFPSNGGSQRYVRAI